MIYIKDIFESIIDFPKKVLNPEIWYKKHNTFVMNPDLKKYVLDIIPDIEKEIGYIVNGIRLTGSNTSTQYTSDTDLDFHLTIDEKSKNKIDDLNKIIKDKFKTSFIFKTHPVEFYIQSNIFQDLASIGCYDVLEDEWLVGPDLKPTTYNPYEEFKSIFSEIESVCSAMDIKLGQLSRRINDYDTLMSALKTFEPSRKTEITTKLSDIIQNIYKLIESLSQDKDALRKERQDKTTPKNDVESDKLRNDKQWKRVDAKFKFINKYGYLKIISDLQDILADSTGDLGKAEVQKIKHTLSEDLANSTPKTKKQLSDKKKLDTGDYNFANNKAVLDDILKLNDEIKNQMDELPTGLEEIRIKITGL